MTALTDDGPLHPPPARRRWLRLVGRAAGVFLLVLFIGILFIRWRFRETRLKSDLKSWIESRSPFDCEIASARIDWMQRRIVVEQLSMTPSNAWETVRGVTVDRIDATMPFWSMIVGRPLDGIDVEISRPELRIAPTSNARKKRRKPPRSEQDDDEQEDSMRALRRLRGAIRIRDGVVRVSDPDGGADRVFQSIELDGAASGFDAPFHADVRFSHPTPESPDGAGAVRIDGSLSDASATAFADLTVSASAERLDWGPLARCFGVRGRLLRGDLEWTLGRPVSGELKWSSTAGEGRVTLRAETDGLVALWRNGRWVAGKIPARLDIDAPTRWRGGPLDVRFAIGSPNGPPTKPIAELSGMIDPATGEHRLVLATHARLDDLIETDFGDALRLRDRMGGTLDSHWELVERGGDWRCDGHVVQRGHIVENGARRPTGAELTLHATVSSDGMPRVRSAQTTFALSTGSGSAFLRTQKPIAVGSLNDPSALNVDAAIEGGIRGGELWREYGPLLAVFNLSPQDERLDLVLNVAGRAGRVHSELKGELAREGTAPQPLSLMAGAEFDGPAWRTAGIEEQTFARFDLRLASPSDGAVSAAFAARCSRTGRDRYIEVPTLSVDADLERLSPRLHAWGEWFPILKLAAARGHVRQRASLRFSQSLGSTFGGSTRPYHGTFCNTTRVTDAAEPARSMEFTVSGAVEDRDGTPVLTLPSIELDSPEYTLRAAVAPMDVEGLAFSPRLRIDGAPAWVSASLPLWVREAPSLRSRFDAAMRRLDLAPLIGGAAYSREARDVLGQLDRAARRWIALTPREMREIVASLTPPVAGDPPPTERLATVVRGTLEGKGVGEGFLAEFDGSIDAVRERFAPRMEMRVLQMPKKTGTAFDAMRAGSLLGMPLVISGEFESPAIDWRQIGSTLFRLNESIDGARKK